MAFLQKQFNGFHDNIRVNDLDDNQPLREKRDMLIKILEKWCKENGKPSFQSFNQGSYAMGTGNQPLLGEDYDIDVGLEFDIDVDDYEDPVEVKQWVYDAFDQNNFRVVEMKDPCVRVQYHKKGEVLFHIDFAIYGTKYGFLNLTSKLQLAKGKKNSTDENKYWEDSEPRKLKEDINSKFSDKEERYQFKRCIRYLKRWKDVNFNSLGTGRPTGISMTAMAYDWFEPEIDCGEIDDFTALTNLVENICNNNHGLNITLPVKPYNDLMEKLKVNKVNKERYIKQMDKLRDALLEAAEETDPHDAAKILKKVFGDDFPVPNKASTARVTGAPAITTSSQSA
jgi:hypothetical protein